VRILIFCLIISITKFISAQNVTLYEQHNGRFDYTAIGNTLNIIENGAYFECSILTSSDANLFIESNQIVRAAYLYWAGSGEGDFDIKLNDNDISPIRTFSYNLDTNRQFFSAFSDVTEIVQDHGNGTYILSELDNIDISENYCSTGTNFAGWSIIVEAVPNEISITLDNLNVLDVEGAKIGFIAWEGDVSLAVEESLNINGYVLSNPPLNPSSNAFNGTNSFTGESNMHNMDIDVYDIQNTINVGDTYATIQLTSGQDLVMVNCIITVLNSQLADATIKINEAETNCFSRKIILNYSVFNSNSTDLLPAETPISFYINDILVAQTLTDQQLDIDESLSSSIEIEIDADVPEQFEILAVVDDIGNGSGIIDEISETNNTQSIEIMLSNEGCPILIPEGFSPNGDGLNDFFNIQGIYDVFVNHKLLIYNRNGALIFRGDNNTKWYGTSNNGLGSKSVLLPVGTYFYVLYLNEENYNPVTGWVYLNY
jgi:gliding motility-associated-like protein